ncbi:uncharacterized protein TNCV_3369091 [Trichonephila clavipes]|uniref:Uncharacterized protein n=1 Tax=Trichonephila clavipes TaxID=2585209 RepID=A0A8X6R8B8_TRICX|nr:uncharacterized protein TNCV_3369091 [Trichonephila clavipes]
MESCLPEEVLVARERNRNHDLAEFKGCSSLEQLMNFVRQEVKGKEIILLARTGFTLYLQNPRKKDYYAIQVNKLETTTAVSLINMDTPGEEKLIGAVIESGSQSTYVSENVMTHLRASPLKSETVIHALFGE